MSRYKHWRWYVLITVWVPVMAPLAAIGAVSITLERMGEAIQYVFDRTLDKHLQRMKKWEFKNRKADR